jgi:hypothetical protein
MEESWSASDRFGIIKPSVDAHVLGVTVFTHQPLLPLFLSMPMVSGS